MAEAVPSSQVNDLLIQIGRSLLQYVSESWPWAASGEEETRRALDRLAAEQYQSAAALARLLVERGEVIDFGTYPTEYTSLHYVAVDFLLAQLVRNQEMIVRACEQVSKNSDIDSHGGVLLRDITEAERNHLSELRRLAEGS